MAEALGGGKETREGVVMLGWTGECFQVRVTMTRESKCTEPENRAYYELLYEGTRL